MNGRKVLMEDLKKVFEDLGFANVRTIIASGNVLFNAQETNESTVQKTIEKALTTQFGFSIPVILRTREEIQTLIGKDPFKNVLREKGIRMLITLYVDDIHSSKSIKKDGFMISVIGKREVASIVFPDGKSTELMIFIDKTFGKKSTTRNWNTILKIIR